MNGIKTLELHRIDIDLFNRRLELLNTLIEYGYENGAMSISERDSLLGLYDELTDYGEREVTVREIKKHCDKHGIKFEKCSIYQNGPSAYRVRGRTYARRQLVEAYKRGAL